MKLSMTFGAVALAAAIVPAAAGAQDFDLRPGYTQEQLASLADEVGADLRFRQLGDTATLGRGNVDIGVQFAETRIDDSQGAWNHTRVVARFGVNDRVDVGAWGGFNPNSDYGVAGVETKILLLREGPSRPVSVSVRPSLTSLVGPSEVWVGTTSVDLTVSRAFGPVSPYAGVAARSSIAMERSTDVDLDHATAEGASSYAGVAYRWRSLSLAGEVEKGEKVSYGFRIGTRF
jgi:hypothetical protein